MSSESKTEREIDPVTGREEKKIRWREGEIDGTSFRGLWNDLPYSFEETVARLITVSGQNPIMFEEMPISYFTINGYKTSFDFHGTYEGKVFTLYDYKGDYRIHIGGKRGLNLEGLKQFLAEEIADSEPTPYEAVADYHPGIRHQWP